MKKEFTATYLEFESTRPFDEVIKAFEGAVGSLEREAAGFDGVARAVDSRAEFERLLQAREGSSGFMRFLTLDHGTWMRKFEGATARAVLYTLGNPLLARTMLQHDMAAGLDVPVRVLIYEGPEGRARLAYHEPSSLMSVYEKPEVMSAARQLDAKLAALAELATGSRA